MSETVTILVTDDDPQARELLAEWLALDGFRVETAADGPRALARAAASVPDLVLLDVVMPGMDGFEVCRRLRADPRLAEVPVILITALGDRESRLEGIQAGADELLTKPYDASELLARVRGITRLNRYRRLLAERAKFEWVVESSEDGYLLLGEGGEIVYANPAARLYLGRPPGDREPFTEPFLDLACRRYRCEPSEAWTDWPAPGAAPQYLVRAESATAPSLWLRVEALELPERREAHHLVRLRDETSRIELKRDVWKFNALVAHKLRTSLTTLLGGLELLDMQLDQAPKAELAELVGVASQGAGRLKDQVLGILSSLDVPDLARAAAAGFSLARLPALADELARSLDLAGITVAARDLPERHLALSTEAFELILDEVLGNSKKFHPAGSPSIELRATVTNGALELVVRDDGLTVPPELLARVWAPYFQGEKGFSGNVDGLGLGLSVVASLVWGVAGRCRIYNREDGPGVVVELVIPLAKDGP